MRSKSKDKVQVNTDRGMLRLRWSYINKRYSLNLGLEDTRSNRTCANHIASKIAADMRCGSFDITRNKYRPKTIGNSGLSSSELFNKFTTHKYKDIGVSDRSIETRYKPLSKALQKWLDFPSHEVDQHQARNFFSIQLEHVSAKTTKERIGLLRSCWEWAQEQKLITKENPWIGLGRAIKPLQGQGVKSFTHCEIQTILAAFRNHPKYCHYADFVTFLFGVGCRFGEAAGLQWQHLESEYKTVWIGESISRGYRRSTKTGKPRTVVLSPNIQAMLRRRYQDVLPKPSDLVFPSPKGLPICDRNFRNRAWKSVLKECEIEYRKPYSTRHTAINHALENGANPLFVAEQSGHDLKVLLKNYRHAINSKSIFVEF